MLIGGMVDNQLGNNFQTTLMRFIEKCSKVVDRTVIGIDIHIIGNIIPIVSQRRRIKRQQPDRRNTKTFKIGQLLAKSLKITNTVIVAVKKCFDMSFINDGILVPLRLRLAGCTCFRHKIPIKIIMNEEER